MGVPKFFRYISERYPCLSELVKEYQIPEFDNLYLDMNGIIHMCSHPDDHDPFVRISEEKMFTDIFHYIEVLFRLIKPQKLFFMAIDGVAPRAKMNQQRSRRFRSAKDAERAIEKAREKGQILPDEMPFDSNCITPGTAFMARLHEQLKYFIIDKITKNTLWQQCKVILSGHETPGEGEHKIMDYIRWLRAQPGYDPHTRHCLYGLDADLIMLGLCTHDPHFSLLREEVKFGKRNAKRKNTPEELTFFLLHLSLMREYLEQEFIELKEKLSFGFDLEKIIDDWVLMGFLVGNDFIPHLPHMHIANGSLQVLYSTYIQVMPTLDGYINEAGCLHLERFEKFMEALHAADLEYFSEQYADLKYFESKTGRRPNDKKRTKYKPRQLEEWQLDEEEDDDETALVALEENASKPPIGADLAALIKATEEMFLEQPESVAQQVVIDEDDELSEPLFEIEFQQYKRAYYMHKLEYAQVTPEVLHEQAEGYVRAIQWVLNYYYNGVCSWAWFYPHHYAPFISDIKNFKTMQIEFDLGTPFNAYEQLLAVLPTASKRLLPECYHKLMDDDSSPIKDFYPQDFNTDLNGKKQDWEAVTLIPFIDEKRLLDAMVSCNSLLTAEEVRRNTHGPMLLYTFTNQNMGDYEAPEYFPVVRNSRASRTDIFNQDIRVDKLVKGAYPGAVFDVYYPGFPTLKHLKYTNELRKGGVKVFDQASRHETMFIQIEDKPECDAEEVAKQMLGKTVFVAWPHLIEAFVTSISSKKYRYYSTKGEENYTMEENKGNLRENWQIEYSGIADRFRNRLGIDIGETSILVHVKLLTGRKYVITTQGGVQLEKQWTDVTTAFPWQTVVTNISSFSPTFKLYERVEDIFTLNSTCFLLGLPHYGYQGDVQDSKEALQKGRVKIILNVSDEPNFANVFELSKQLQTTYMQAKDAALQCALSKKLFSQVTGCILIAMGPKRAGLHDDAPKQNIGLNLKLNSRNEEVPGYTQKDFVWLYSQKTVDLVLDYINTFPLLFDYLERHGGHDHFECDMFPDDEGGESLKEIMSWLKKQPHFSIERQACGSQSLEPDVVKAIEACVNECKQSVSTKAVTMQVKPFLLYKPGLLMGNVPPDAKATYQLYDRVVNVRDNYTVPLGYSGTIIAIHKAHSGNPDDIIYDVLFDEAFAGGLTLNCSPCHGYKMTRLALISKSHGLREMEKRTCHLQQKLKYSSLASAFCPWFSPQGCTTNATRTPNNATEPSGKLQDVPANSVMSPKESCTQPSIQIQAKPKTNSQSAKVQTVKQQPALPSDKKAVESTKLSVQDIFAHASASLEQFNSSIVHPYSVQMSFDLPKKAASFSIELLNQYCSRGLGCPIYHYYYDKENKSYQAQLKIPVTKEIILGPPGVTKEEASDNAAEIALQKLPPMSQHFLPSPPLQWRVSESDSDPKHATPTKKNNFKAPNEPQQVLANDKTLQTQQFGHRNANQKESSTNRNQIPNEQRVKQQVPFVPLQAIKQQRMRNNSSNQSNSEPVGQMNQMLEKSSNHLAEGSRKEHKDTDTNSQVQQTKPRRVRKMRLAANFSMNCE